MGWSPRLSEKGESEVNTNIHAFLIPNCGPNVAKCHMFLAHLPFLDGVYTLKPSAR